MKLFLMLVGICISMVSFTGCGGTEGDTQTEQSSAGDEHDHDHDHDHDHGDEDQQDEPVDFATALASVETMKETICSAFAKETPEDAHDELHEVGHTLEKLPELAGKSKELAADQQSEVNRLVEVLFDGFGKLDDTLHGGEAVDIAELDKELTQALADLKEAVQ